MIRLLTDKKDSVTWHKGLTLAVSVTKTQLYYGLSQLFLSLRFRQMSILDSYLVDLQVLDEIFEDKMQSLLGVSVKGMDLEAPRSIMELRSMISEDKKGY